MDSTLGINIRSFPCDNHLPRSIRDSLPWEGVSFVDIDNKMSYMFLVMLRGVNESTGKIWWPFLRGTPL